MHVHRDTYNVTDLVRGKLKMMLIQVCQRRIAVEYIFHAYQKIAYQFTFSFLYSRVFGDRDCLSIALRSYRSIFIGWAMTRDLYSSAKKDAIFFHFDDIFHSKNEKSSNL